MRSMKRKKKYNSGIIGMIVLIIIALIILGYLGINIKSIINSPVVQQNLQYAWGLVVYAYGIIKKLILTLINNKQNYAIPSKSF